MLQAPTGSIDKGMIKTIAEWDSEPTALQLLKTIDHGVHWGACTDQIITILDMYLRDVVLSRGKSPLKS